MMVDARNMKERISAPSVKTESVKIENNGQTSQVSTIAKEGTLQWTTLFATFPVVFEDRSLDIAVHT